MNHTEIRTVIRGLPEAEQAAYLQSLGLPENHVRDYLNWINQPVTPKREKGPQPIGPYLENEGRALKERMDTFSQKLRKAPAPSTQQPEDLFQKDIQHNQFLMGGPSRLDSASFYNPDLKETQVIRWLRDEFAPGNYTFGLLLGGTGSGKTFGWMAYMNRIANVEYQMDGRISYSNTHYLHAYKLAFVNQDQIDGLARWRVLLIDDVGTEPDKGFTESNFLANLQYLVNERHKFERHTFMTANFTAKGFKERYGERILSRFNEIGLFLETTDPDLRQGAM